MTIEAVLILLLGVFFLFLGWRSQNGDDKDTIAYLKGLALLKKETKELRKDLSLLNEKIDDSLGLIFSMNYNNEISQNDQKQKDYEMEPNPIIDLKKYHPPQQLRGGLEFSDKYREVIALSLQGFTTAEIASQLSISQDAVTMVLNTSRR